MPSSAPSAPPGPPSMSERTSELVKHYADVADVTIDRLREFASIAAKGVPEADAIRLLREVGRGTDVDPSNYEAKFEAAWEDLVREYEGKTSEGRKQFAEAQKQFLKHDTVTDITTLQTKDAWYLVGAGDRAHSKAYLEAYEKHKYWAGHAGWLGVLAMLIMLAHKNMNRLYETPVVKHLKAVQEALEGESTGMFELPKGVRGPAKMLDPPKGADDSLKHAFKELNDRIASMHADGYSLEIERGKRGSVSVKVTKDGHDVVGPDPRWDELKRCIIATACDAEGAASYTFTSVGDENAATLGVAPAGAPAAAGTAPGAGAAAIPPATAARREEDKKADEAAARVVAAGGSGRAAAAAARDVHGGASVEAAVVAERPGVVIGSGPVPGVVSVAAGTTVLTAAGAQLAQENAAAEATAAEEARQAAENKARGRATDPSSSPSPSPSPST